MKYYIVGIISMSLICYRYRYNIILNTNFYLKESYGKFIKFWKPLKVKNIKKINQYTITDSNFLKNNSRITNNNISSNIIWYQYDYDNYTYITNDVSDLKISNSEYLSFKDNKFDIISPDNIIMAELNYNKNRGKLDNNDTDCNIDEIQDVLSDIKMLAGPYINKINKDNTEIIYQYFTNIKKYKNIYKLEVMFSNGITIYLNFNNFK